MTKESDLEALLNKLREEEIREEEERPVARLRDVLWSGIDSGLFPNWLYGIRKPIEADADPEVSLVFQIMDVGEIRLKIFEDGKRLRELTRREPDCIGLIIDPLKPDSELLKDIRHGLSEIRLQRLALENTPKPQSVV